MKPILAIVCAVLIGSPAMGADQELRCRGTLGEAKGWQGEGAERRRLLDFTEIEFQVSVSDREITFQADPKYQLGPAPVRSVLKLVIKKSDAEILDFESVERMKRPGYEAIARIAGTFSARTGALGRVGTVWVYMREDEFWALFGQCEFLVGARSTIAPKVT